MKMNKRSLGYFLMTLFVLGSIHASATDTITKQATNIVTEAETKPSEKQSLYTCPMHPEVQQSKPGQCPKCGMDLVPVKPAEQKQKNIPGTHEHHH